MPGSRFIVIALLLFLVFGFVSAVDTSLTEIQHNESIDVTIYYGRECPHCHTTIEFIEKLQKENPLIEINKFEVYHDQDNQKIYSEAVKSFGYDPNVLIVPFTIIGEKHIIGERLEEIEQAINECAVTNQEEETCPAGEEVPATIDHILFGKIDISQMSLPMLTFILGIADGFNPCAMWVLVYLIAMLIETKDKKKIWLIVGTFVFASAVLYFIFLTAWLNLFLFLGFLSWIQVIVGLIAIATGIFHIREHLKPGAATCAVTDDSGKKSIMDKIKKLTEGAIVPATIVGLILLAFTVNLIEFVCSAGIPAVFTKILTLSDLSTLEYYGYILLYDFFFMLDDIIIFGGAALALNYVDINGKYVKFAGLFGGIVLLLLGIILIFFPELLAFV